MRSFSEYKGIEVSGRTVHGLILAFGQFRAVASKYLLEEGVGQKGPDGLVTADPASWYPMDAQLRALARFRGEMGDSVVHQIGVSTAKANRPDRLVSKENKPEGGQGLRFLAHKSGR